MDSFQHTKDGKSSAFGKRLILILASELLGKGCGLGELELSGISCDSRKTKPGDLFIAVKGKEDDGHRYIQAAVERGAVAVILERAMECSVPVLVVPDTRKALADIAAKFYGTPAKSLKLIGVTGTNGKTTVTYLIKSILEAAGETVGLIGTNEILAGQEPVNIRSTTPTTPDSAELQQIFARFVERGIRYAVMEVSSHALALDRVRGCTFDAGVFTNLTQDHLDFHKTMEQYLAAKSKLFDISKTGVINIDDAAGRSIAKTASCRVVTVGLHDADIRAKHIQLLERGVQFAAEAHQKTMQIQLAIPGKFSVYNALCAIGACDALGISQGDIVRGLAQAKGVRGRVELVPTNTGYTVIIDYAHSPDGLEKILHTVRGFARGRVITLFGCGGDRDRTKRPIMGNIAGRLSDFTIVTSDNPRTEDPMRIIADIEAGIRKTGGEYVVIGDRREAIAQALKLARKDDVVLLAGKGQETYQIIGKEKLDFDEREVVKEILAK